MQLSAMLDLVIGLAFMYFLLSMIASYAQELIAGFLNWRGTYLSKGLDVILDNNPDATFGFYGIRDWLTAHLTPYKGQTVGDRFRAQVAAGKATANPISQQVLDVQKHPLMTSNPATVPSYISAKNFSLAMLGVLQNGSQAPLFAQAEATVAALPAGDLTTTLSLFVQTAGGDVDKFRTSLESWFDDAMDRVSGIYKRLAQYVMFVLGLSLAAALNVDTTHVVKVLWESPSLRSTIVGQATQAATTAIAAPNDPSIVGFQDMIRKFEDQQFPVGWSNWRNMGASGTTDAAKQRAVSTLPAYIASASLGWLLTAFAVSLGGPFWFGLLQHIVNLRSAGIKPQRADRVGAPAPADES
jgi:hypothetical protein